VQVDAVDDRVLASRRNQVDLVAGSRKRPALLPEDSGVVTRVNRGQVGDGPRRVS
jgi:hypothetical protein